MNRPATAPVIFVAAVVLAGVSILVRCAVAVSVDGGLVVVAATAPAIVVAAAVLAGVWPCAPLRAAGAAVVGQFVSAAMWESTHRSIISANEVRFEMGVIEEPGAEQSLSRFPPQIALQPA